LRIARLASRDTFSQRKLGVLALCSAAYACAHCPTDDPVWSAHIM